MSDIKRILLAEDNAKDAELTLAALEEYHLSNEVMVVRDGEQVLRYLKARAALSRAARSQSRRYPSGS